MAPPWTQFEVTLKDENGNPRLVSEGDPITVIAPLPSQLQGRVFLTKPDAGTETKNRELQVPHHELKVLQDQFYDASDVPPTSPSDVPSTSP
jgi:hypothetical protein